MKKLFLLLITFTTLAFSTIDDCKTDVYFGNGVSTELPDAQLNTGILEEAIKQKFDIDYFNKKIGKVFYAYNSTHLGGADDFYESFLQKLDLSGWNDALARFLFGDLLRTIKGTGYF